MPRKKSTTHKVIKLFGIKIMEIWQDSIESQTVERAVFTDSEIISFDCDIRTDERHW